MTPRDRSAGPSEASLVSAPRSLNELVTCRFSYLTKTSAPVSAESFGAGNMGVRRTTLSMTRRAASISAIVTLNGLSGRDVAPCRKDREGSSGSWHHPLAQNRFFLHLGTGWLAYNARDLKRDWSYVDRHQAPRLRSGDPAGAVRRCAGAPRHCFHYRLHRDFAAGCVGGDVHFRLRNRHLGARFCALLAAAFGDGDLGDSLLRLYPRQPRLCHDRHADDGPGNAHLVWRTGLFRARRSACHRLLVHGLFLHAFGAVGPFLQRAAAPPARHSSRHGGH